MDNTYDGQHILFTNKFVIFSRKIYVLLELLILISINLTVSEIFTVRFLERLTQRKEIATNILKSKLSLRILPFNLPFSS